MSVEILENIVFANIFIGKTDSIFCFVYITFRQIIGYCRQNFDLSAYKNKVFGNVKVMVYNVYYNNFLRFLVARQETFFHILLKYKNILCPCWMLTQFMMHAVNPHQ